MIATTATGTVTVYSNRFSISGMTGTFAATYTITGTAGPATVNNVADTAVTSSSSSSSSSSGTTDDGVYGTPFQSQTGLTRYAPMGLMPGTTITATNTEPQYPTSSVALATTYLSSATIDTTLTQAQTASFTSHANTVSFNTQTQNLKSTRLTHQRLLRHRCLQMIWQNSWLDGKIESLERR